MYCIFMNKNTAIITYCTSMNKNTAVTIKHLKCSLAFSVTVLLAEYRVASQLVVIFGENLNTLKPELTWEGLGHRNLSLWALYVSKPASCVTNGEHLLLYIQYTLIME